MLVGARTMTIERADAALEQADLELLSGGLTREQFSRRVAPFLPQVFRFCLALAGTREAAEDLLQNALVRAYTHRDSFRGEGSMAGWVCSIARNEHLEHVRTAARRRGLMRSAVERFGEIFEDWLSTSPEPSPQYCAELTEDREELLEALQALPQVFRTVVWLCDVEDMAYADVSELLHLPVGTVKSRHARGRERLRQALVRSKEDTDGTA
jgi:RNA polymerase sigma-70 factor (ECF subfamily)